MLLSLLDLDSLAATTYYFFNDKRMTDKSIYSFGSHCHILVSRVSR